MAIKRGVPTELLDLKGDKQLFRQQHPVASRFVLVIWLVYGLLTMVCMTAFVGGFLMMYGAGLNYLRTGTFFIADAPESINGISIVIIFLVICLVGLILINLERPVTNLYRKYYED